MTSGEALAVLAAILVVAAAGTAWMTASRIAPWLRAVEDELVRSERPRRRLARLADGIERFARRTHGFGGRGGAARGGSARPESWRRCAARTAEIRSAVRDFTRAVRRKTGGAPSSPPDYGGSGPVPAPRHISSEVTSMGEEESRMSENRTADIMVGFGIGLLVGAVSALLLAPASGEATRRRIGELADSAAGRVREGAQAASDQVRDQARRLGQAFQEGKEAYQRESKEA